MIKIGMMYDEGVVFGREVEEINRNWAAAHGHAFISQQALPDPALDPYWNRIPFIRENLDGCDWFVWLDADVIVVNPDQDLVLPPDKAMAFSHDYNGLCCGAFAVRNSAWSRSLLDAWLFLGRLDPHVWGLFDTQFMREQTTMKTLVRLFPNIRNGVGRIPEDVIQNMYSVYCPTALAIHTWAGWTGAGMVRQVISRLKEGGYRQGIMQP